MTKFNKVLINIGIHLLVYALLYSLIAYRVNKPAFPSLTSIPIIAYQNNFFEIFHHLPATLLRWLMVFLIGVITGVFFGIIIGYTPPLHRFLRLDIDFFRSLPATALIVYIMAAFGDNEFSRTLPALYITFFTILFYVTKNAIVLKHPRIKHLKELGASNFFIIKNCILFELLPPIFIAIRQSVSLSFLVLISVELIVGPEGNLGIGGIMYDWMFNTQYANAILCLLLLGIIGYLLNISTTWINRKLVFWQETE